MIATLIEPARSGQVEAVVHTLTTFVGPGQVAEVRALGGPGGAASRCGADLEALAVWALAQDAAGAAGVYFVPNPLRPDLAGQHRAAADADVVRRRWLLIDVDPVRPAGTAAARAQRQAAWAVACRVRGALKGAARVGPVLGDSGNGWHLCYPLDLPNDDAGRDLVRDLLRGLQARCGDQYAKVDTSTFNAARIWRLYGTHNRKGEA